MMSLLIAMSIDYSLFLLSRYREELLAGTDVYRAVQISLGTAGQCIHPETPSSLLLALDLPSMFSESYFSTCAAQATSTTMIE